MANKKKSLHYITGIRYQIRTQLQYNTNTDHITIGNEFYKYKTRPTNKNSTQYLGIICAEQILDKVFKNAQRMPTNNSGFDFICNNGYLVDSKSACKHKRDNNWNFHINKNKIADYFALLAFDNRDNTNPLHFWLIPGNIINNQIGISISESTISKWDKYRQDIDKVIKCCDILKGDK